MNCDIFGLKYLTYNSPSSVVRVDGMSLRDYLAYDMRVKLGVVRENIKDAVRRRKTNAMFFCIPEFYWNVPWDYIYSADEINELFEFYFNELSLNLKSLMEEFQVVDHDKFVFIAGSVALLLEVNSFDNIHYEAINYSLVVSNFTESGCGSEISMWPKRFVSKIDFGEQNGEDEDYRYFTLGNDLKIDVVKKGDVVAEHNGTDGYGSRLNNVLFEKIPFSINLCVDYREVLSGERNSELAEPKSKVDFLISCGMPYSEDHIYPESVIYSVRNDGYPTMAGVEVRRVENGRLSEKMDITDNYGDLYHWLLDVSEMKEVMHG